MIDFISEWSSTAPIGRVKKSLPTASSAHITDTQKTLSTMVCTKIEKKVSAPSHHHKTKRKRETEIILTETGIEKKSFLIT